MSHRLPAALLVLCTLFVALPAAAEPQRNENRQRDRDRDRDQDRDQGPIETEVVERTLQLPTGGSLRLKTFSGRVTISGGSSEVVIKATRRASRERLRDIRLEITQAGSVIDIDANHALVERRNNNIVETDFEIRVPTRIALDLRTFSAPVIVNDIEGEVIVEGFSGAVRLTNVSGTQRIKTFSGEVHLDTRDWTAGRDVSVNTFSGAVTMRLPDSARGDIEFDSFSGRFTSDLPVQMSSTSKRSFRGTLNGGGGQSDLRLHTFSGSVRIEK